MPNILCPTYDALIMQEVQKEKKGKENTRISTIYALKENRFYYMKKYFI